MNINVMIARRLRELRDAQQLSLDSLATKSGVSRSNISLIERGQSSASATVLDKLAAALGVTLASLFEGDKAALVAPSPVSRAIDQGVWTDPASGYVRRNLSPAVSSAIQLVEVHFPAGQRVAYDSIMRDADFHQQVWIIAGVMEILVGDEQWRLKAGDCLAMPLDRPIVFFNPGRSSSHYLVALATPPGRATRRNE